MDFGLDSAIGTIASGTSAYLVEFMPVILLVAGLVLAVSAIELLIDIFAYYRYTHTYAPGEYMANLPEIKNDPASVNYYRSNEYPGNTRLSFREWRKNRGDVDDE